MNMLKSTISKERNESFSCTFTPLHLLSFSFALSPSLDLHLEFHSSSGHPRPAHWSGLHSQTVFFRPNPPA